MDYLEVIVGLMAVFIAIRALYLQRYEIIKNGQITALIHTSNMIQDKISYHSKIIDDMKSQGKQLTEWEGHATRINKELRPVKEKVDFELLDLMGRHEGVIQVDEIKSIIKAKKR